MDTVVYVDVTVIRYFCNTRHSLRQRYRAPCDVDLQDHGITESEDTKERLDSFAATAVAAVRYW